MTVKSTTVPAIRSTRLVASIWGILAGIGGVVHGIGEALQGPVAPSGIVFNSWAQGPIATHMGGEPAMSLIPNLFITGMVCIVVSLAVAVWAASFVDLRHGGRVLLGLALVMLLVGGGFGPPIVGLLAGWAGTGIGAPSRWWRERQGTAWQRAASLLWWPLFSLCLAASLLLFVGSLFMVYVYDLHWPEFFSGLFLAVVPTLLLAVWLAFARDTKDAAPSLGGQAKGHGA